MWVYAFLGKVDSFAFCGAPDLSDPNFVTQTAAQVPLVLERVMEPGQSCSQDHACQDNADCKDAVDSDIGGHRWMVIGAIHIFPLVVQVKLIHFLSAVLESNSFSLLN